MVACRALNAAVVVQFDRGLQKGANLGQRFITERMERAHAAFSQMWTGVGQGRYWKRQLSKARRRAWKQDGTEGKLHNIYEGFCAYKGW